MNWKVVTKLLGTLSIVIGLSMVVPLLWALHYGDAARVVPGAPLSPTVALIVAMAGACLLGVSLLLIARNARGDVFRREGLFVVGVGWMLTAALGAIPYMLSGVLPNAVDAYFESMSGFTTTGSTVIADIEAVPKGILFWRSFTHWLGGMGITVLFLAVLPALGAGGKHLFRSEVSQLQPEGLRPRIKESALILWRIYVLLTVLETTLLWAQGMSLFDALCHTFGTLATAGFSTRQASVGAYNSLGIELTIIAFMVVGATNFALHYQVLRGRPLNLLRDIEWRVFIVILAAGIAAVTINLLVLNHDAFPTPGRALRSAAFQVTSIMTTTGFTTADFDLWPGFTKLLLVVLMCIGGCSGSTAGGLKMARLVILARAALLRLEKVFRPQTVRALRLGGTVLSEDVVHAVAAFFVLYMTVLLVCSLVVAATGTDIVTAFSSVTATLNTTGPGLSTVGAAEDFSRLAPFAKLTLALTMVMGRLELFAILVLFVPAFWKTR
ncbi:MAG: TrkH family potassium uptake protein [Verrucomicrobia bacterium]|nr:TrkH family potassium uptake protein [Verrucomicrobiota bacterium]